MREQFDNLIVELMTIQNFSKDIHYTCHGDAFYSIHLLVDKFNFDDAIDLIKECCLLGNGDRALVSVEYMQKSIAIIPIPQESDDRENFKTLNALIFKALNLIDSMQELSKADENVTGGIAQDLQQYKG